MTGELVRREVERLERKAVIQWWDECGTMDNETFDKLIECGPKCYVMELGPVPREEHWLTPYLDTAPDPCEGGVASHDEDNNQ